MPSEVDLAWAAGFYDGEGSCSLRHGGGVRPGKVRRPSVYMKVHVGQKDPRPLQRFHRIVGVGGFYTRTHNGQPFYDWSAQSAVDVAVVENMLWPYLSEPKREQFSRKREEAKALRATYQLKELSLVNLH